MTDLSPPDPSLSPVGDLIPDLQSLSLVDKNQAWATDSPLIENHVSLADLHQVYIDRITNYFDPKSLLRLELTCKSLFVKGTAAQHLMTITPHRIHYGGFLFAPKTTKMRFFPYGYNETQFRATRFRFRAGILQITGNFTAEGCDYIEEQLGGMGTIEKLDLVGRASVAGSRFNKFLQDFHISELTVQSSPRDYFDQPCVQKLEKLSYIGNCPASLRFFLTSNVHSGRIAFRREDINFDDLNLLLKKWAANEKVIEELVFPFEWWLDFDKERAFAGWTVVHYLDRQIPGERPVVICKCRHEKFRLIRADEAILYVTCKHGALILSTKNQPNDSASSDDDDFDRGDFGEVYNSDDDIRFNIYED